MAAPTHGSFESDAKVPVRVLEEDRHLQFRLQDVMSKIGNESRNPQSLRDNGSSTHDDTVEYPNNLAGILIPDVLRSGTDKKGNAFLPRMT
jgi:hypothetical protein